MYKAMEIAYWFLYKNYTERKEKVAINDEFDVYEGLTHLKLQELLYNAQGVSLALNDEPLFEESIEAGENSPIIDNVYSAFHLYHGNFIIIQISEESNRAFNKVENNKKTRELLEFVYDNFAIYTAWQLQKMSNSEGTPWYNSRTGEKIENDAIKEYFKKEVVEE